MPGAVVPLAMFFFRKTSLFVQTGFCRQSRRERLAETADMFRAAATPVPASLSHPIPSIYFRDFRDTRLVISSQIKSHFRTTWKGSKS